MYCTDPVILEFYFFERVLFVGMGFSDEPPRRTFCIHLYDTYVVCTLHGGAHLIFNFLGLLTFQFFLSVGVHSTEAGVLDKPYSAKPAQRSSHTGPPSYIGWTRLQVDLRWFQPMQTVGPVRLYVNSAERGNSNGNASETKAFDSKQIIFETKRTHQLEQKLYSKRSKHVRQQDNCF